MTSPTENLAHCLYCDGPCPVGYGRCHCRCGGKTNLAVQTQRKRRDREGFPVKFLRGHNAVQRRVNGDECGRFKIDGVYCRLIPLTQGQWAIVDEQDYQKINLHNWMAHFNKGMGSYYAARNEGKGMIRMHVQVGRMMGITSRYVDHRNPWATTENRRKNLRPATASENCINSRMSKNNTSGYKGVFSTANPSIWRVQIMIDRKTIYLGRFRGKQRAAQVYLEAAKRLRGEFARPE